MRRLIGGDGGTSIAISIATVSIIVIITAVIGTVIALALIPVYGSSSSTTVTSGGDNGGSDGSGVITNEVVTTNQVYSDHTQSLTSINIVDKKIISASNNKVVIRNTETNVIEREIVSEENITSLKFVDSTTFITVTEQRKLVYYSSETGQRLKTISLDSYGSLTSVLVTSDKKIIITSESNTILILNESGEIVKQILVCEQVTSTRLLSSGDLVYSTKNSIYIRKKDTYEIVREIKVTETISYMIVAKATTESTESIVYTTDYKIFISTTSGVVIKEIKAWESFTGITQLSNGLIVVSINNYLLVYNLSTGLLISTYTFELNSKIVVIESNENSVICGTESGSTIVVTEFESFTKTEVSSVTVTNVTISTVSVSNKYKICSCSEGKFYAYDKSTGSSLFTYSFGLKIISTQFLTSKQSLIVTEDGSVRIFNIETKEFEKSYSFGFKLYKSLIFSKNILLFTDLTGSIHVLDSSLTFIKKIDSHSSASDIYALDLYTFASYHGTTVKIWRSSDYSLLREFNSQTNFVSMFKIKTGELVTVDKSGLFKIWSTKFESFSFKTLDFNIQITECRKLNSDRFLIGSRAWFYEYSLIRRRIVNIFAMNVNTMTFDLDHRVSIGSLYGQIDFLETLKTFYVYNSRKSTWSVPAHKTSITCLTASRTKIVSGDNKGSVVITNKRDGKVEHQVSVFEKSVFSVHFVDNEFVFTMCDDGCLAILSLINGQKVKSSGLENRVSGSLVLNNKDILVSDILGTITVLDIDLNVKKTFSAHTGPAKIPFSFSESTRFVTFSQNIFKIWQVSDYTLISESRTITSIYAMVILSNKRIISLSKGGRITIWASSSSRFNIGRQSFSENKNIQVNELEDKDVSSLNSYPDDKLLVGSNDTLLKYDTESESVESNNQVDNNAAVLDSDGGAFYGTNSGNVFLGESNNTSSLNETTTLQTNSVNQTTPLFNQSTALQTSTSSNLTQTFSSQMITNATILANMTTLNQTETMTMLNYSTSSMLNNTSISTSMENTTQIFNLTDTTQPNTTNNLNYTTLVTNQTVSTNQQVTNVTSNMTTI